MEKKENNNKKEILFESAIEERAFKRAMDAYNEEGGTPYKEFFRKLEKMDEEYELQRNIKTRS